MSRRIAAAFAGTLVVGLLVAVMSISLHPREQEARRAISLQPEAPPPIVRRVTRTVTIHKKDQGEPRDAHVITVVRTQAPTTVSDGGGGSATGDAGYVTKDEHGGDEHHGDEHHGDDGGDDDAGDKF